MKLKSNKNNTTITLEVSGEIDEREMQVLQAGIKKLTQDNYNEIELIILDAIDFPLQLHLDLVTISNEFKKKNGILKINFKYPETKEMLNLKTSIHNIEIENSALRQQLIKQASSEMEKELDENRRLQTALVRYDQLIQSLKPFLLKKPLDTTATNNITILEGRIHDILNRFSLIQSDLSYE